MLVVLAAAVLTVLVTPVLNEIPCTVGNNTRYPAALASVRMLFLTLNSPPAGHRNTPSQLPRVMDVLSSSCILVC
jgi:hypothetical protein